MTYAWLNLVLIKKEKTKKKKTKNSRKLQLKQNTIIILFEYFHALVHMLLMVDITVYVVCSD